MTSAYDFLLPEELIAQHPLAQRDQSRLLVCHRDRGTVEHRLFRDLPGYLRPGDLLVMNDSKVIPARLFGIKMDTGAKVEILLIEQKETNCWVVLLKPAKRVHPGGRLLFQSNDRNCSIEAVVEEKFSDGQCLLRFQDGKPLLPLLECLGSIPLPPYIRRKPGENSLEDRIRYQTVYASKDGSVAAPTAGLHFTEALLKEIQAMKVEVCHVTLHVGPGTFAPVKTESIGDHKMHSETFEINEQAANRILQAKAENRRVIAVGTTSVRVLESAAGSNGGRLKPIKGSTRLFVHPPHHFHVVDAMITNFHLPKSTLLMLVSAFASPGMEHGREMTLRWYREAINARYRFFSYGDAMFVV